MVQDFSPASYRALLFDLFGTLVFLRPPVSAAARAILEAPLLRAVEAELPAVSFERFLEAVWSATRDIHTECRRSHREVSSPERFRRALLALGYPEDRALAERLCQAHMRGLATAAELPAGHLELLRSLVPRFRLGLVSNFDHGPTAREILVRQELAGVFRTIVISDEFGWRKPHPAIFAEAVRKLGVSPPEVLFIGDTPLDDICGARSAGLDAAWINWDGAAFPPELPRPTFVAPSLRACVERIGGGAHSARR